MAEGKEAEQQQRQQQQHDEEAQALAMSWSFGFNKEGTGCVHSLADDERNAVFYFAAHTGVVYDYVTRKQTLLQGHCNPITCCAVSADKRWIATADEGKDAMVVVWDSLTGTPIKTLFNPHANGVVSIDMSPDAMFLVTLGSAADGATQEVALWEWTVDHAGPVYSARCPAVQLDAEESSDAGLAEGTTPTQQCVRFNSFDIHEFATTGPFHVTFWSWRNKALEFHSPVRLSRADFGPRVGCFTHTAFLPGSSRAVTGTTEGNLVMWDVEDVEQLQQLQQLQYGERPEVPLDDSLRGAARVPIKVVKLNRNGAIPYLTMLDELLVVCGQDESVRFYDLEFRIVAWFEDLEAGPVTSVSFSNASALHFVDIPVNEDPNAAAAAAAPPGGPGNKASVLKFALPDFVVSTSKALIVGVDASTFDDPNPDNRHGTLLLQGFDSAIISLLAHPSESVLVAISETGVLQVWNYDERRLVTARTLGDFERPTCAAFSPSGDFVAVGFDNGILRVLRWAKSRDLGEVACFQVNPDTAYRQLCFSDDARILGTTDADNCVSLFRFVSEDPMGGPELHADTMKVNQGKRRSDPGPGLEPCDGGDARNGWTYMGRRGAHTKEITSITFGSTAEGQGRFVSIGQDGVMVEYDLERSSIVDGIQLAQEPKRIEFGKCKPTCCIIQPATKGSREDLVITANSEYKIKCFNANNQTCRRTSLGPTYGGPLAGLAMLSPGGEGSTMQYLAYCTDEKVIGLVKLPLDGNPYKSMGLIAHPREISGFVATHDGRYLLSAGGSDMTVNLWAVNTSALDAAGVAASAQSIPDLPTGLAPYLPLIDGGHEGNLFEEIVDYFFYAQLRCQGEETTSPRRTEGQVPLSEVPNLMRALGFFPTEHQIEDMCSEIRYAEFTSSAKTSDSVNLEQFVRLYLNHRPVTGVSHGQIDDAFAVIEAHEGGKPEWKALKSLLETSAEAMPPKELESCLTMLLGRKGVAALRSNTKLSATRFASEILGFELPEEVHREAAPHHHQQHRREHK